MYQNNKNKLLTYMQKEINYNKHLQNQFLKFVDDLEMLNQQQFVRTHLNTANLVLLCKFKFKKL